MTLGIVLSWPFARGQGYLVAITAIALACLLLGLLATWVRGLGWGIGLLGAAFLVRVQLDPATVTHWTPLVAAGLLLAAELGYWSHELDGANAAGTGRPSRRALEVILIAAASAALCELALDLSAMAPSPGPWTLVLGVASATGMLGILLRLARRAEA